MLKILSKPIYIISMWDIVIFRKPIGMISKCKHAGVIYLLIPKHIKIATDI